MRSQPEELDDDQRQGALLDVPGILRRRRWYILGAFFLLGLAGVGVAAVWPYSYRAQVTVLVEQQKVPEQYVTANIVSNVQERLDRITQQILSRARLQRLIEEFQLYAKERGRTSMDDAIDTLRAHITVDLVKDPTRPGDLTAFHVSYSAHDPEIAQRVANELTSQFIDESLRSRTQQSVATTSFIDSQLQQAAEQLRSQEEGLRKYKMQFSGELPEELASNLQMLSVLETQLRAASDSQDRAEQQKVYLESLRAEYQGMQASMQRPGVDGNGRVYTPLSEIDQHLAELRRDLGKERDRYTDLNPVVIGLKRQIAEAEDARVKAVSDAAAVGHAEKSKPAIRSNVATPFDQGLADVDSRLKATLTELEHARHETVQIRKQISQMEARVGHAPLREQQLAEVTRNYENAKANYQSLLGKMSQSELATNLERRQQGEQFRVIDPADRPRRPMPPTKLQIMLAGWALGLGLGVLLAALRDVTDKRLRCEKDVEDLAKVRLLASIPRMTTPEERQGQKWRLAIETLVVCVLTCASAFAGVLTYRLG